MSRTLEAYLDEHHVKYITLRHSAAYSAHELAAMLHVADRELAKTVIVKADDEPVMVVLPANCRIDFHLLKEELRAKTVQMASEDELSDILPDCELGAMPPFGNLFGLPVYVARPLTADEELVFNDGTFATAIRMSYHDFDRLVQPQVIDIVADE
jgi:Ala-tRNA(Pro) deacylase